MDDVVYIEFRRTFAAQFLEEAYIYNPKQETFFLSSVG